MSMETESLVNDGARYQCTFRFTANGDTWRCPKDAVAAVTESDYEAIVANLPSTITLHGRAMCQTHLNMMEEYRH